jgi:hypothetical protein
LLLLLLLLLMVVVLLLVLLVVELLMLLLLLLLLLLLPLLLLVLLPIAAMCGCGCRAARHGWRICSQRFDLALTITCVHPGCGGGAALGSGTAHCSDPAAVWVGPAGCCAPFFHGEPRLALALHLPRRGERAEPCNRSLPLVIEPVLAVVVGHVQKSVQRPGARLGHNGAATAAVRLRHRRRQCRW